MEGGFRAKTPETGPQGMALRAEVRLCRRLAKENPILP